MEFRTSWFGRQSRNVGGRNVAHVEWDQVVLYQQTVWCGRKSCV